MHKTVQRDVHIDINLFLPLVDISALLPCSLLGVAPRGSAVAGTVRLASQRQGYPACESVYCVYMTRFPGLCHGNLSQRRECSSLDNQDPGKDSSQYTDNDCWSKKYDRSHDQVTWSGPLDRLISHIFSSSSPVIGLHLFQCRYINRSKLAAIMEYIVQLAAPHMQTT